MSLVKPLLVELKTDSEQQGIALDRLVRWEGDVPQVYLGVWFLDADEAGAEKAPHEKDDALVYLPVSDLTTIDVLNDVSDLEDGDEEEDENEEEEVEQEASE